MVSRSSPRATGSGGSTGRAPSGRSAAEARSFCAMWIGGQCYGLDIGLVGELVAVDALLPIPLAPPAVLGLFSLRGTPLALVDLAALLDIPGAEFEPPDAGPGTARSALVLQTRDLQAAVLVDRMETVISGERGVMRAPEGGAGDAIVEGFFETEERGGLTIRVLDGVALLERLRQLKFRDRGADAALPAADSIAGDSSSASELSKGER